MTHHCRHCKSPLRSKIIDLGHQPPSNAYLTEEGLQLPEVTYPLSLYICKDCWLVQLPEHKPPSELFTPDYPYFSSTSLSWCAHAQLFVSETVKRLSLGKDSHVVEVGSNDGYLLQHFRDREIPCLGIEPTHATADAARAKGIETIEQFFGLSLAGELEAADLVIVNNVLAHVPDINDFVAGIAKLLKPSGWASIEFPHLLRLLEENQFDTIYHEHYSYFSLHVVQRIFAQVKLNVVDVERLPTHGGSLRVWLAHQGKASTSASVSEVLKSEAEAANGRGLEYNGLDAYRSLQARAESAKHLLLEYLLMQRRMGRKVLGYGAAAKGNTLLNYAGIQADLLSAVADKAPSKQGRFLPGSHIPVISLEELREENPDSLLVLPWNLISEIKLQLKNYDLVTAIPTLRQWTMHVQPS